ncbi:iron-containing alcohol dehydrogenase family protein [Pantoea phytobeneficialis]|uniref:Alcohol dehydrogenase n=1 Tax=Pantoea phytobeneficialis TaxID=2052056 RepID=A0AAP9KNP1_9GAMM|nr:iron-containing alcohol dehydrogenase family protein [Pantoea phytobeneficialis]MDO6409387.1 iron-containing alcohol dehydrogenase family protein [Pantoea phytobeneficialis]QGR06044.1 alcohol dehydrogenase [Pantoea phytobeneficialis]
MTQMNLVFPARVLRGAGVINQLGEICASLGQRALLIGGHQALQAVEAQVRAQLLAADVTLLAQEWFGGETSLNQINRLAAIATELQAEVIIGVGGGKSLDTCKAVAAQLGLPVVTIPTIAATCSAVTPLSIRYDDNGNFFDIFPLPQAPAAVVIDSTLLAKAPPRWLAAGLGDTLAKWYEFRAVSSRHPAKEGNALSSLAHSKICYDVIAEHGPASYAAVLRGESSSALDQVLDAIFTWAGLTSLMSNGAHAAASHAIYEGFTFCDKTREFGHGLLVGFGNLCLLALEQRSDDEVLAEMRLARDCGVPLTLTEIADLDTAELALIVRESVHAPDMANMAETVTDERLLAAIARVEKLATQ